MPSKSVIVGTAGHIDHGKTALVKALTGIDADRLEEEKRRGITIDIGFAHTELSDSAGSAVRFGFVDVPGHEKFVRNMLAGIGGIDMVLLIIAADEGIKPQTREHFEICKLLNIHRGITVITKTDKVAADALAGTRASVETFLRGSFLDAQHSPVVAVSANTGAGIDDLRREMLRLSREIPPRSTDAQLRLPIDRVFTMKGFGTVVTGTLVSGTLNVEDEVETLPGGRRLRVRGLQVHNQPVNRAMAGERTAINLAAVQKEDLTRGMTLTAPGSLRTTLLADAQLTIVEGADPPRDRTRFHFHCYTSETIATLQRYSRASATARLRFADPQLLLPGDRFILRRFSPATTIGGGVVLDAAPMKASSESFLLAAQISDPVAQLSARIERRGQDGLSLADAVAETGWARERVNEASARLVEQNRIVQAGDVLVRGEDFQNLLLKLLDRVRNFHAAEPLAQGMPREDLRHATHASPTVFAAAIKHLVEDYRLEETSDRFRLPGQKIELKDDESQARAMIENAFASAGLRVPAMKEVVAALPLDQPRAYKIVTLLLRDRILIKLSDELIFHTSALTDLRKLVQDHKATSTTIDVAHFKDMTGVSRKYAIPLLEFLDRERITRREGNVRIIL